jgi:geranylgeranyl transferase type-2 subunit beta
MVDVDKHTSYLLNLDRDILEDSIGYYTSEHLKMGGAYWTIGSLACLDRLDEERKEEIVTFVGQCKAANGGYGGNINHDPHITNTHYAVLVLAMFDSLHLIDADEIAGYISGLQNPDGSFKGDEWGEVDLRFSYCALSCLKLLGK